jgi:hypothetical protein
MKKITEITRNEIIDIFINGFQGYDSVRRYDLYEREYYEDVAVHVKMDIYGKLDEVKYLGRIFDLKALPSTDSRFDSAEDDIWQHRINNYDWDDDWLFDYESFNLRDGSDEKFLDFIVEVFHPAVRKNESPWPRYLHKFNELLKFDGYEIYSNRKVSGREVYTYRRIATDEPHLEKNIEALSEVFDSAYIDSQMQDMIRLVDTNPSDAIGKAKELLESCCKTILEDIEITINNDWTVQRLMKEVCKELKLTPEEIDPGAKAASTIKQILGNLTAISAGMAELRNSYGSGHGKKASYKGLSDRHARLAISSSIAAVRFIWDTYQERKG